ncbi:DNA primase [Myxococcota bacterium]|nr:DNA primase [Myxococcota bacterium]MBU1510783.1 DNA primase [Myxococcota bacterium]
MRFGSQQLQQIRKALRIADVVGARVTLHQSGAQLRGACPFHQEKDPSFYVYPDKDFYICYGCQAKGDIFDFLMRSEGYTFSEAVQSAAAAAGIELEVQTSEEHDDERRRERQRQKLYHVNEVAMDFFRDRLHADGAAHAREYLEKRGLGPELLHHYRIGYAPDSWDGLTGHLQGLSLIPEALEVGLLRESQQGRGPYDFFRDRIMFPIADSFGNVRGFSSRILQSDRPEGKYVNSSESSIYTKSHSVYGLHEVQRHLRQADRVLLVEGNVDVLTLAQAGLPPTVAPLGTALTAAQIQLLMRYTQNVWLMFDGDSAGRKATLRALPLLLEAGSGGKVVLLPEPHDPDTFVRKQGVEALRLMLDRSLPVLDTFLQMTLASPDAPISERVRSLEAVAGLWKWVPAAQRGPYMNQIALMLRLDVKDVRPVLEPVSGAGRFRIPASAPVQVLPELNLSAEEKSEYKHLFYLICFLSQHERMVSDEVLQFLGDQLASTSVRDLWRLILEDTLWKNTDQLLTILPPAIVKSYQEIAESMKNIAQPEETLSEFLRNFKLHGVKRKIRELDAQLQALNKQEQGELYRNLLLERMNLEKTRNQLVQFRGATHDEEKDPEYHQFS